MYSSLAVLLGLVEQTYSEKKGLNFWAVKNIHHVCRESVLFQLADHMLMLILDDDSKTKSSQNNTPQTIVIVKQKPTNQLLVETRLHRLLGDNLRKSVNDISDSVH